MSEYLETENGIFKEEEERKNIRNMLSLISHCGTRNWKQNLNQVRPGLYSTTWDSGQ